MATGKRIKDPTISEQTTFNSKLRVLVDRIDTGSGDWLQARNMELGVLGNTYYQGSTNGINWHEPVTASDTFIRFSTDGGTTWINLDTDLVQEGNNNLYFTEARVLATPGVQDSVDDSHTHTNKALLDNLTDGGSGVNVLTDDGTYKSLTATTQLVIKTSNYTASSTDGIIFLDGSSNTVTLTLPSAVGNFKKQYSIKCIDDTFICDVATNGIEEIDGSSSNLTIAYPNAITIVSDNANWWII